MCFYRVLVSGDSADAELKRKYAFALLAAGKAELAADIFEEVLATDRTNDVVRLQLAYAYLQSKQFARANKEFIRVLANGSVKDARERAEIVLAAAYATRESGNAADATVRYEVALGFPTPLFYEDLAGGGIVHVRLQACVESRAQRLR